MKTASVISTALHVGVLLWAILSFTGKTLEATPVESLPVDLVTTDQFSKMMKGAKEALKKEEPAPLVEKKKEEPKPVEEPKPKITEKKEVPTPPSSPPPAEAAPPKSDAIADKLKKPEPPKEAKVQPNPTPPKKPVKDAPKFDADKIAALLDKREPQRNAATGAMPNSVPALGASSGNDKRLSQSELDALRARLMALWNPPVGMQDAQQMQITIRIRLKRDGTLADGPQVVTSGTGPRYNALRDSAVRAIMVGAPFTMLRPENFDIWKEIDFTFDTSQMFQDIPVTVRH